MKDMNRCIKQVFCKLKQGDGAGNYDLNLCNSFGQCVSKSTTVEPQFLSMNSVSNKFIIWLMIFGVWSLMRVGKSWSFSI